MHIRVAVCAHSELACRTGYPRADSLLGPDLLWDLCVVCEFETARSERFAAAEYADSAVLESSDTNGTQL